MEKTQAAKRDTSTTLDILETKTGTGGISCEPGFIPENMCSIKPLPETSDEILVSV